MESCTVCPPLKLLLATLRATVAEVESAPTSATSRATVSPCVHHLQHCLQLLFNRDASLRLSTNEFPPVLLVTADHRHRTPTGGKFFIRVDFKTTKTTMPWSAEEEITLINFTKVRNPF